MSKKKAVVASIKRKSERTLDELIQIQGEVIDEGMKYLKDDRITLEEKRRWAKVVGDNIAVLNKLLSAKGEKPLDDEDLGSLLLKVPKKVVKRIKARMAKWVKASIEKSS